MLAALAMISVHQTLIAILRITNAKIISARLWPAKAIINVLPILIVQSTIYAFLQINAWLLVAWAAIFV